MCGLIAAFNKNVKKKDKTTAFAEPVNEFMIKTYENQFGRGTQGFGVIRVTEKGTLVVDRATEPVKFMFDLYRSPSDSMIVHHRNPTSTDNKMSQTHPIIVRNDSLLKHMYAIIHNGICTNAEELKPEFEKLGFKYTTETKDAGTSWTGYHTKSSFNDSESFAIAIALLIEKHETVCKARGDSAFIAVQMDLEGKILRVFFGRNGGVLNMSKTRGKLRLSSAGEGQEIPDETMFGFAYNDDNMELESTPFHLAAAPETKVIVPAAHAHSFSSSEESDMSWGARHATAKKDDDKAEDQGIKDKLEEMRGHDPVDDVKSAFALVTPFKEKLRSCTSGYEVDAAWSEFKDQIEDDIYEQMASFTDCIDPNSYKVYGSRLTPDEALGSMRYLLMALDAGSKATMIEYALYDDKTSREWDSIPDESEVGIDKPYHQERILD